MDNRLKFLYCRHSIERSGDAGDSLSEQLEELVQGDRESGRQNRRMIRRPDGEGKTSTEVDESALTRKAAIESEGTRTANRHR